MLQTYYSSYVYIVTDVDVQAWTYINKWVSDVLTNAQRS